jgi:two-component system cell cycle sensor histidine kinase/response regulator CckA
VVGGPHVRLTVTDTGHGMDASVLGKVFEPFFTTKPMGKGTGLGLSTVYGIVKQSGGYVWIDSAPGSGTSVHLDFPVAMAPPKAEAPEPALRVTPARGLVMVVEDEPAVRAMVSRVLQDEGYEVVAAQDGQEALSVLAGRNGVRLVVSDVAMPVMNGRELGDRLALIHPGLPVLYMSGFADDEIISRGLLEPGRPFIQKPFESELFARRVAELLQLR